MDDKLFKDCEVLIMSVAKKFYGIDREDLMQAGKVGLINAYNHYNKQSNTKFSTFAYTYIYGEMYNLLLNSKMIKTNRDNLKLVKLIDKTKSYLTQTFGREISLKDISNYLEIDEHTLENALLSSESILSLDRKNDDEDSLYNVCKYDEDNDIKIDIKNSIENLNSDEKEIIKYRYFQDLTQSETAKILGISQVKVSRYEQKTLKKLKKMMMYE